MDLLLEGFQRAFSLILHLDAGLLSIVGLSLRVSALATLLALVIGVPAGVVLALVAFPGRNAVLGAVNTGMSLPPVVVGLFVSIMLWRRGPFGALNLIYTPTAIVIAQVVIALPIIAGLTTAAVESVPAEFRLQMQGLGASRLQLLGALLRESRLALLAAVMAGFGGAVSEIGASMMVGGNIEGYTRVMTTAIALEVSRGDFALAMALGIILLAVAYVITYVLTVLQQRERA